jgi:hypothetical protein
MGIAHALVDTRKEFDDLAGVYLPVAFAVVAIVFGARRRPRSPKPSALGRT